MESPPLPVSEWARPHPWAALRVRQWAHFLVLPLAAIDASIAFDGDVVLRLLRGVVLAALAMAYAYGLNAISDRATDLDRRKNPLAGRDCPPSVTALVLSTAVAAIALATTAHRATLAAVAVSLASSTVYSVGPRLKTLPAIGTLLNAGIFAPLLVVAMGEHPPASLAPLAIAFVALLLQNQLLHECADAKEDEAAHAMTTARALSARTTTALIATLGIAAMAACVHFAPSATVAWTGAGACAAATASASAWTGASADWARRRVVHRWTAFAAGALLFGASVIR